MQRHLAAKTQLMAENIPVKVESDRGSVRVQAISANNKVLPNFRRAPKHAKKRTYFLAYTQKTGEECEIARRLRPRNKSRYTLLCCRLSPG